MGNPTVNTRSACALNSLLYCICCIHFHEALLPWCGSHHSVACHRIPHSLWGKLKSRAWKCSDIVSVGLRAWLDKSGHCSRAAEVRHCKYMAVVENSGWFKLNSLKTSSLRFILMIWMLVPEAGACTRIWRVVFCAVPLSNTTFSYICCVMPATMKDDNQQLTIRSKTLIQHVFWHVLNELIVLSDSNISRTIRPSICNFILCNTGMFRQLLVLASGVAFYFPSPLLYGGRNLSSMFGFQVECIGH